MLTNADSDITDIVADDSTIYLFGSELYCGWCLEAFTCPVRLKIHCHIEHLATCACGEEFGDKQSLCRHVASAGCLLPPPFHWSHFVHLTNKANKINITEASADQSRDQLLDENETAKEEKSDRSVKGLGESVSKTNTSGRRKELLRKHSQNASKVSSLQVLKRRKFCCGLCPFQSANNSHCHRHIRQKHGKDMRMLWASSGKTSAKQEDEVNIDNKAVAGTPLKASAICEATVEDTLAGKSECSNLYLAGSESCCKKHTSDDIQFVFRCFSSTGGDRKLLCCHLCRDKFVKWENAAMHIYNLHFSALQRWRDARADLADVQPLREKNSDKLSADSTLDVKLEELSVAVESAVPKTDDSFCSEEIKPNVSELPLLNLEHNHADTFVDQSKIHPPENESKHKVTADECKALASSLCRLLNCWNGEPETGVSDSKTNHTSEGEVAVTTVATEELSTASYSEHVKLASSESTANKQLVSHKCKFCQRVCSTGYNCQRHEAVCCSIHRKSKPATHTKHSLNDRANSFATAVRVIHNSGMFYCIRCGFSASDQHAVYSHLMKPHIIINNRLHMDAQSGYEYFESMKVGPGIFKCSVCGVHRQFRSDLLKHMQSHSSPAVPPGSVQSTKPESLSDKVEESTEKHSSGVASAVSARSCPKCSRLFPSVAGYVRHRAICRAVQPRQAVPHHLDGGRCHFLLNFCEQASDGRWNCKMCKHVSFLHRCDAFKHIRGKHKDVQKTEMETTVKFSKKREDGLWQCKLCTYQCAIRYSLYRHIRVTHAAKFTKKPEIPKLRNVVTFCVPAADGRFQCTLCKCLCVYRSNMYKHIRAKHGDMLWAETSESTTVPSAASVSVSTPSTRKHTIKNTHVLSVQRKSQVKDLAKRCPNCSRMFANSGYHRHVRSCNEFGLNRFVEAMPSGRHKCLVCDLTYSFRTDCIKHLRRKHLLSGELKNNRQ